MSRAVFYAPPPALTTSREVRRAVVVAGMYATFGGLAALAGLPTPGVSLAGAGVIIYIAAVLQQGWNRQVGQTGRPPYSMSMHYSSFGWGGGVCFTILELGFSVFGMPAPGAFTIAMVGILLSMFFLIGGWSEDLAAAVPAIPKIISV